MGVIQSELCFRKSLFQLLESSACGGRTENGEQIIVIGQKRKDKTWYEAVTVELENRGGSISEEYVKTLMEYGMKEKNEPKMVLLFDQIN